MNPCFSPGACSLAAPIALREPGLPHLVVPVELSAHRSADGAVFHAIHPKGRLPPRALDEAMRAEDLAAR